MRSVAKKLVSFLKKEDGPTAVEYAVMLALIIAVCIFGITAIGSNANGTFGATGAAFNKSSGSGPSSGPAAAPTVGPSSGPSSGPSTGPGPGNGN